jgi:hypothetical protein
MKKRILLLILEGLLFIYAGIAFYYLLWFLIYNVAASFVFFVRFLPYFLMNLIPVYLLFVMHLCLHPVSIKRKKLTLMVNGGVICLLGFLTALFAAIFAINGTYSSIVMGGVTHLYPLDSLLLGLLYSFGGFALYFYGYKKYDGKEDHFPTGKIKQKVLKSIFRPIFALVALFFIGALAHIFYTMDYSMKNWWEMLSFYLLMALPSVELGFYEYGFKEEMDPITSQKKEFHYSVWMALSALLTVLFFFIAYLVNKAFLVESGVAYLPADFLKSIPFGPVILFVSVLVAPLVAFFHFLSPSKKKDTSEDSAE